MKKIDSFSEYKNEYKKSLDNPELFWAEKASTFQWKSKWNKVLNWDFESPIIEWFIGGKLNITENCLDRHLKYNGDKVAILWEPNDPNDSSVKITYSELHKKVCEFANVLLNHGAKKGDRISWLICLAFILKS